MTQDDANWISGFSEPVNKLIDRVSDAIGVLYEPTRIKRSARAEVEANLIRAEGELRLNDLQRRGLERLVYEEAVRQENIESVANKALPYIEHSATPEDIDRDWLVNFFDQSRLISDEEIQDIWARLLAGEANSPRSFSKQTVNTLALLDKSDAELFTRLCSFTVDLHPISKTYRSTHLAPLIHIRELAFYKTWGINFEAIDDLSSLGLIRFSEAFSYVEEDIDLDGHIDYFGQKFSVQLKNIQPEEGYQLAIGNAIFTRAGQELTRLIQPEPVEEFIDFFRNEWLRQGIITKPLS